MPTTSQHNEIINLVETITSQNIALERCHYFMAERHTEMSREALHELAQARQKQIEQRTALQRLRQLVSKWKRKDS